MSRGSSRTPLERRLTLKGAKILVLGAGGAARAAVFGLRDKGAEVFILNRTPETARKSSPSSPVRRSSSARPSPKPPSTSSSTPPRSAWPAPSPRPLLTADELKTRFVFDLVYNPIETPLIRLARQHNIPVITGVEMFVLQGARQFEIWTGKPAPERRDAPRGPALAEAAGRGRRSRTRSDSQKRQRQRKSRQRPTNRRNAVAIALAVPFYFAVALALALAPALAVVLALASAAAFCRCLKVGRGFSLDIQTGKIRGFSPGGMLSLPKFKPVFEFVDLIRAEQTRLKKTSPGVSLDIQVPRQIRVSTLGDGFQQTAPPAFNGNIGKIPTASEPGELSPRLYIPPAATSARERRSV